MSPRVSRLAIFLSLCLSLLSSQRLFADQNEAPVADPGGPYAGLIRERIQFEAAATGDAGGEALTYFWDFGDNLKAEGQTPIHAYAKEGVYVVTLTVHDGVSKSEPVTTTAVIRANNSTPEARAGGEYSAAVGVDIEFDGSGSLDPDGVITLFTWDFGDGSFGSDMKMVHAYAQPGKYSVSLTVTDNQGLSHSSTTTANIIKQAAEQPKRVGRTGGAKQITVVRNTPAETKRTEEDWKSSRAQYLVEKYPQKAEVVARATEEPAQQEEKAAEESLSVPPASETLRLDQPLSSVPPPLDGGSSDQLSDFDMEGPLAIQMIFSYNSQTKTMTLLRQKIIQKAAPNHGGPDPDSPYLLQTLTSSGTVLEEIPMNDPTLMHADWFANTDPDHPDLLTGTTIQMPQATFMVTVPFDENISEVNLLKSSPVLIGPAGSWNRVAGCPIDQQALKDFVQQ